MGVQPNRDFASLLDELIAAAQVETDGATRPSIPFDYLSVVEELHSGRIQVADDVVAAEYRDTASNEDVEALFAAVEPMPEELPVDPEAISRELNLGQFRAAPDFARIRRTFALKNHPDRVAPPQRERAIQRMQIANMLIDEAKRRAVKAAAK